MVKKSNQIRMKVQFEQTPIMDVTKCIKDEDDLDDMVGELKLKLFGR